MGARRSKLKETFMTRDAGAYTEPIFQVQRASAHDSDALLIAAVPHAERIFAN
jgi:hypothetical protein